MPNELERLAVQRVIDQATAAGIEVPAEVQQICTGGPTNGGAVLWARAHPDDDGAGCCWGEVNSGPAGCNCWVPIFDTEQADPVVLAVPGVQTEMCGDCAFRKGSPERADAFMEEALLALPAQGKAFYCHEGMRRPARWQHPDGRTIPGSPDDWQPAMVRGVPFRADGQAGLLCAGWAARAARVAAEQGDAGEEYWSGGQARAIETVNTGGLL